MFKTHFIDGLRSTGPEFPLHLWCRLILQALITLNLLCASRINPRLSVYAQLHGAFDFNKTPIAPPGTLVISHKNPDNRGSWEPHGVNGWYTGQA